MAMSGRCLYSVGPLPSIRLVLTFVVEFDKRERPISLSCFIFFYFCFIGQYYPMAPGPYQIPAQSSMGDYRASPYEMDSG